jgi:hypothetical protein
MWFGWHFGDFGGVMCGSGVKNLRIGVLCVLLSLTYKAC